jgi:hypothetical protein
VMKLYLDRAYGQPPELPTPEPEPTPPVETAGGCSIHHGSTAGGAALVVLLLCAVPFARRKA